MPSSVLGGLLSYMKDQQTTDVHIWLGKKGMALCCIWILKFIGSYQQFNSCKL